MSKSKYKNQKSKKDRYDPRNPEQNISRPLSDSENKPIPQGDETTSEQKSSTMKNPMFWINLLTLIVIGVYTYFAHQQVSETQNANAIAKKALTEVNKPYIMFAGFIPNYTKDNTGVHFHVGIQWTNLGNTPASYVRVYNCDPIIREDVVPPVFDCRVSEAFAGENVVGPKQNLNVIGPIIKESDFDDTKTEKKAIYIFGYVTYQDSVDVDVYGNPEQRVTRFCQRIIKPNAVQMTSAPQQVPNPQIPATLPSPVSPAKPNTIISDIPTAPGFVSMIAGVTCPSFSCIDDTCRPLH